MSRKIHSPYSIDFDIEMSNFEGDKVINLKRILLEFQYNEDFHLPFTSLKLVVNDTEGIIERFPIVGDELIAITFNTRTLNESILRLFKVNKVSKRTVVEERNHIFAIEAFSYEFFENKIVNIEKSFVGKLGSEIVETVFNDKFKKYGKEIDIEPTSNLLTINSNTQSPISFIDQVSRYSYSWAYDDSVFKFYEDKNGYNFKSINSFLKGPVVENYIIGNPNVDFKSKEGKEPFQPYQSVYGYTFNDLFDTIKNLNDGMLDSSVDIVDPITKTYVEKSFGYYDNFDKLTHLSNNKIISDNTIFKNLNGSASSRYMSARYKESGKYKDVVPYMSERITADNDPHLFFENERYKFLLESNALKGLLLNYTMDITVPGNSLLKIGDIINLFIPQNSQSDEFRNKFLLHFGQTNPKFIITAIKHMYQTGADQYVTILHLCKESFDRNIQSDSATKEEGDFPYVW